MDFINPGGSIEASAAADHIPRATPKVPDDARRET